MFTEIERKRINEQCNQFRSKEYARYKKLLLKRLKQMTSEEIEYLLEALD